MNSAESGTPSAEEISALSLHQLKEIRRHTTKSKFQDNSHPLDPRPEGATTPLSFAQERMWFLEQLGLTGSAYNMPWAIRLIGDLDIPALRASLKELVRRHEVLRTHYETVDGIPAQIVNPLECFEPSIVNLLELDGSERDATLSRLIHDEARRRFDLTTAPSFRAVIVTVGQNEHLLVLAIHHIAADGWSVAVLNRELSTLYRGFVENSDSSLPPMEIQYADYAIWERRSLQGSSLDALVRYWRKQLEGMPPELDLPTDFPRSPIASFRGAKLEFSIPDDLYSSALELVRTESVTLFMLALGAFNILLSRYSAHRDILVGSAIANRAHSKLEGLIGFFANTLVLRTNLEGNPTCRELMRRVKDVTLGAYAHQDMPFHKLVSELRPERSLTRQPIFNVALAWQNAPKEPLDLKGVSWIQVPIQHSTALFDLTLQINETPSGLSGSFEYATDLFRPETVFRMSQHIVSVLSQMILGPDRPIDEILLLTAEDRRWILNWQGAQPILLDDTDVVSVLEANAASHPLDHAVSSKKGTLTYQQLNCGSNLLAHQLFSDGLRPGSRIGVYTQRGVECLLAFYAILKIGGVYVPLDANNPTERLRTICEDSDVEYVLLGDTASIAEFISNSPNHHVGERYFVENRCRVSNVISRALSPRAPAYIIYTSGSTGRPKGVLLHRLGLSNIIASQRAVLALRPRDRVSQIASIGFDASIFEFVLAVGSGACLFIGEKEDVTFGDCLANFIAEYGITATTITPSALSSLNVESVPSLQTLLVAGEEFPPKLARAWSSRCRVFNAYGPTEFTIWATVHKCSEDTIRARVPIGVPINHTRIHLLDSQLRLVAVGEVGEIYIGGIGLAVGYINRQELNDLRFIDDPICIGQGKLYRSGDLGRWRSDGTLEFLGRADGQVKIRGYRVEPGEIEAAILEHESVNQAVVQLSENSTGEKHLAAYIVAGERRRSDSSAKVRRRELEDALVQEWEILHDGTYGTASELFEPSFLGWNSSFTGDQIPDLEMEACLRGTVRRLRELRPTRVLEIGCGVGLILRELAPDVEKYIGSDISNFAIEQLRSWVAKQPGMQHVELMCRPASRFDGLKAGSFDLVVLNSVVQYFPNVAYLVSVLKEASEILRPGGYVFLGDVRSLRLLPLFHAAVQIKNASSTARVEQLRLRVQRAIAEERELAIDQAFFEFLPSLLRNFTVVSVDLKSGGVENELTLYRYDVVLQVGTTDVTRADSYRIDWRETVHNLTVLSDLLRGKEFRFLRIHGIPDRRLSRDLYAVRLLEQSEPETELGALRQQLGSLRLEGVYPEEVTNIAVENGYQVRIAPAEPGFFEVLLLDGGMAVGSTSSAPGRATGNDDWLRYANNPTDNRLQAELIPELQSHLRNRLPGYMVPSAWVMLKQIPLTSSGKVDRNSLPGIEISREPFGYRDPPQGRTEEQLAEIWCELLHVDHINRTDNFFQMGGHSLLTVRLVSQINRMFGSALRVIDAYRNPTVKEMGAVLAGGETLDESIDLETEAKLDIRISLPTGTVLAPSKSILLTGGTGFVGRFLLDQLLRATSGIIFVLVRADTTQQATSKLKAVLSKWDLWRDEFETRIVAVPGDLRLPNLGIDQNSYSVLCQEIDSIYHCAVSMNHLETYAMAKSANVGSVKEIFALATSGRLKQVNFLSTLGIFTSFGDESDRLVDEYSGIDAEVHSASNGYLASKWVGEKLCTIAASRGVPCNIFRLGLMWADSQKGRYDDLQRMHRIFKSCLLSGFGISDFRTELAPTPVDYAACAVVTLANQYRDGLRVFHISACEQMSGGMFESLIDSGALSLKLLSYFDWILELRKLHLGGWTLPAVPLVEFAFSMSKEKFLEHEQDKQKFKSIRFDCRHTHSLLRRLGLETPVFDESLVGGFVNALRSKDSELVHIADRSPTPAYGHKAAQ